MRKDNKNNADALQYIYSIISLRHYALFHIILFGLLKNAAVTVLISGHSTSAKTSFEGISIINQPDTAIIAEIIIEIHSIILLYISD
jgi:hypothetical protein